MDTITIEQVDGKGKPVTVPVAYWNRYPSLHDSFRPVAEKKTTPVVAEPPTGDTNKEN